jgi:hypothetical protein
MKKFAILLILLLFVPAFQSNSEDPGAYIPWQLVGEGVKQGVYNSPSFYWRVNRGPAQYEGYYTFYLYLLSNSGQTEQAYQKYQQQQQQQQQQSSSSQRMVRPTELYDFVIYEQGIDDYGNEVYVNLIDPSYVVVETEITRPIVFYSTNEFPSLNVDWSEIIIY